MSEHTPGPWTFEQNTTSEEAGTKFFGKFRDEEGRFISSFGLRDARLIAAAPDLLAAFKELLREFPEWLAWRMDAWVVRMKDVQEGTGIDVLHRDGA